MFRGHIYDSKDIYDTYETIGYITTLLTMIMPDLQLLIV
jgi:hypothetical protein